MKLPVSKMKQAVARCLAAAVLLGCGLSAGAVTDAEMDEARAIAGKFYVRYINNGAGYLDNWTPKTMAELEKKLTNKTDRENLKKFKSVATPTDYASWDKGKLVAYWSDAFFRENGHLLDPKGADNGLCRKQIKTAVGRMTIAAPAPAAPEPQENAATEENAAEPQEIPGVEDALAEELAQVDGEIQEAQDLVDREAAKPVKTTNSGTWVYIMVLAILVAVVIFLVVYASKTMKGQPKKKADKEEGFDEDYHYDEPERSERERLEIPAPLIADEAPTYASETRSSAADDSRMREKYAEALAAKAEEIRSLNRQLADMENLTSRLKDDNRRLTAEVEQLRKYATATQPHPAPSSQQHDHQHHHQHPRPAGQGKPREIYLGRVNSKGIFIRADRHAVDGQSIYKLTTTNGQQGTYALINNPLIEEQVLDDPGKWLAGGCFAKDIFDTEGRQSICMETPGTAVFRDGAWRVEKKAKIRYC